MGPTGDLSTTSRLGQVLSLICRPRRTVYKLPHFLLHVVRLQRVKDGTLALTSWYDAKIVLHQGSRAINWIANTSRDHGIQICRCPPASMLSRLFGRPWTESMMLYGATYLASKQAPQVED